MKFINKSTVVKEIDRRIELFISEKNQKGASQIDKLSLGGRIAILQELKVFLYTLEVKEVDLEVDREAAREKSILDETKVEYFATGKPTIAAYSEDSLRNQFDAGADWMKEQIIKVFKEN